MPFAYPLESVPQIYVDPKALAELVALCSKEGRRVGLIGFNEMSKHIVNLCGDSIKGFYDPAPWKTGITFRGKPVLGLTERMDITHLAVCDYDLAYDFSAAISRLYNDKVPLYCSGRLDNKSTVKIDVLKQEQIYKDISAQAHQAPKSMMNPEKMGFVMELLRYAISLPGDIVEMGVWQGGSAWYFAKVLEWYRLDKHIFLVDLFEKLVDNRNATMCHDEIARSLSFYPHVTMMPGLINDPAILSQLEDRTFCFAHYDLAMYDQPLELLWQNLSPGAPLILDNYGHLAANPVRFERFFEARGTRIIRQPWSEQGLVFKR
jgi:predicted O-methyltransferase YrrM